MSPGRIAWALLAAGGLVAALLAPGAPAVAAPSVPAAACPTGTGVTVVVDFGTLGGGTQIRCVTEPVSTGFEALTKAGFTVAGTTRFPAMLCRIDGKPSAAQESCVNAPPAHRYWAYWTASRLGGTWSYNDVGAGNRTPVPGSVEGWGFSDGCRRTPGSGPCSAPATTTTTARPAPPTSAAATPRGPGAGPVAQAPPRPGGSSSPTTAGAETSTTTEPSDGGPTSAGSAAGGDRAPVAGEEGDAPELASARREGRSTPEGGGSPAGVLAALSVLVLLVGAGAWRRRSKAAGP